MLKFDLQRKPSLWAVCAAGLSALHVAGLIKHSPVWGVFQSPRRTRAVKAPIKRWISVCTVRRRRLLPSLDILCVSSSQTVTFTCTCAGPTTPTCPGRSTPKTLRRVLSWVPVSLQDGKSTTYYYFFSVCSSEVYLLPFKWLSEKLSSLRSSCSPQVTLAPSWWSTRRRCTSLRTVGRRGDRCVTHFTSSYPHGASDQSVARPEFFQPHLDSRRNFSPLWKWHPWPFCVASSEGFWGGASHPLPGPRWGDRRHQGHLHPPQDTQVRILPTATHPPLKPLRYMNAFVSFMY